MTTVRKRTVAAGPSWGLRCLALVSRIRESVLAAVATEHERATACEAREDERDLFDRLPEPAHRDYGDVKTGDGKLRFLD